ncbi:alpha/beta-hydrolase [Basidiobolus meristosporus CBS 931.73]|uniref:Alpha/beta-hydrolase n=1 Tax=Basidiobolus meristosporus CBS 931.73 TaxID=1314790 RepID=A0A1Y1VSE6_9FUNG|nr:alpha/beta-hydrolase [Basidiobolus meristosporus CBS 931.73]|eukprot:ORX63955.1 alpha/beta-hydrolase [Basidiobolus meristosporus CBS 931.73]
MPAFDLEDLEASVAEWEEFRKSLPPTVFGPDFLSFREKTDTASHLARFHDRSGFTTREQFIPVRDAKIKVRIYEPNLPSGSGPYPLVMLYHGGGFFAGNLDTEDRGACEICVGVKAVVVDVEYRLAPEHKFPIPVNDCFDALQWALANANELDVDVTKVVTTGTSAGGSLALAVALMDLDSGHRRIHFIAAIHPITCHVNHYPEKYKNDFRSIVTNADADVFNIQGVNLVNKLYLRDEQVDGANPYYSMLLATNLSSLPPTYIVVGGKDPLRDDGVVLAKELLEVGVPCELDIYRGYPHGFMMFPLSITNPHYRTWVEKISNAVNKTSKSRV